MIVRPKRPLAWHKERILLRLLDAGEPVPLYTVTKMQGRNDSAMADDGARKLERDGYIETTMRINYRTGKHARMARLTLKGAMAAGIAKGRRDGE